MKICKKCNVEFEGIRCKPCYNLYMKEWNEKNPEKVKATKKKKYEKNKDHILAKTKEWAEQNKEKSNAIKKAYKDRNREKVLEESRIYSKKRYIENRDREIKRKAEWRKNNPDKVKESQRLSNKKKYLNNKEKVLSNNKKWAQENREKVRDTQRKWKEKNKDIVKKRTYEYIERYPEKKRAVQAVNNAIMYGKMTRPTNCSRCLIECKPEGHHPDYSKPLEVIWLCKGCHTKEHRK